MSEHRTRRRGRAERPGAVPMDREDRPTRCRHDAVAASRLFPWLIGHSFGNGPVGPAKLFLGLRLLAPGPDPLLALLGIPALSLLVDIKLVQRRFDETTNRAATAGLAVHEPLVELAHERRRQADRDAGGVGGWRLLHGRIIASSL